MTRKLKVPGDKEQTIQFCVDHFIEAGKKAIEDHGYFYVALSGGSTPKAIYQKLTKDQLDWSKVVLFWSDERSVGPEDPDSNYKMALDHGFNSLPIPKEQIYRMVAEENIEENALWYENKIHEILNDQPFDYIMLGMGDDGHTASLFPNTGALKEEKRLVVANFVPQKKTWRMTFTYPLINRAHNIVIYVIGKAKETMLKKVFSEKDPHMLHPSAHVGSSAHPALWIADQDASAIINSN